MKSIVFIAFSLLSLMSFAGEGIEIAQIPYRLVYDSVKTELKTTEAKFKFQVTNPEFQNPPFLIHMSTAVNGVWKDAVLDSEGNFSYAVEPGSYKFQFYVNGNFYEIQTTALEVKAKHEVKYELTFQASYSGYGIEVDKPVIYFHTSEPREFDLSVNPAAPFSFVYPQMEGSWKGTVLQNGNISVNGVDYPYLFWESKQQYQFKSEGNGYKVEKSEVITFLEKKLTELGLNQQEKTDFITYWGPKLVANETSFVQFSIDDSCNQFATMNCTPQPMAVRRVYIQISAWEPTFEAYLKDVTFSPIQKSDWYILEWGGFSFSIDHVALNGN